MLVVIKGDKMGKIKIMDELLANKIAAGEVVERCASVVKELVENSIDAKSSEIKIELIEAGTKQIMVIDNGIGMDKEDAVLSFSRHATSKLKNEYDLFHISTLGFRGEALASIASVSDIVLETSTGSVGTKITLKGGKIEEVTHSSARTGTKIVVKNLFYNTPARLKHMKSLYTELASITDYVNKIALSHPDIKFVLTNNDNVLLNTSGDNNQLKTIRDIYGISIAKKMIEIKGSNDDYEISGYISLPEVHRSTRNYMTLLVNGRVVRNMELNKTINDSYHSYKPDNRYPITVINLTVDPTIIDVNIHPTKMDIKFSKLEELKQLISKIIREAISKKTLIPTLDLPKNEEVKPKTTYENLKLDFDSVRDNEVSYEEVVNDDFIYDTNLDNSKDKPKFPKLYPVGLVHGTYIVCQNEDGMYLIDQHAAKERVNYEIYKNKLANPSDKITDLLFPITMELSNADYIVLKQNLDILTNMGLKVEEFGINSIIIKAHPTWLPEGRQTEAIKKIVDLVVHIEKDFNIEKFNDSLAALLACKMSIKANTNITMSEMESLIADLSKCDNPFNCPHGRPTIITFTNYELEKLFKRSGF